MRIFEQDAIDLIMEATPFINKEAGVTSVEEALAGAPRHHRRVDQ